MATSSLLNVIKNSSGIYESNHPGELIAFYVPERSFHTSPDTQRETLSKNAPTSRGTSREGCLRTALREENPGAFRSSSRAGKEGRPKRPRSSTRLVVTQAQGHRQILTKTIILERIF